MLVVPILQELASQFRMPLLTGVLPSEEMSPTGALKLYVSEALGDITESTIHWPRNVLFFLLSSRLMLQGPAQILVMPSSLGEWVASLGMGKPPSWRAACPG